MPQTRLKQAQKQPDITRYMLVVSLPADPENLQRRRRQKDLIKNGCAAIEGDLRGIWGELSLMKCPPINPVRLLNLHVPRMEGHLGDYIATQQHNRVVVTQIRLAIGPDPLPDSRQHGLPAGSHLVQIEISNDTSQMGWLPGGVVAQALVRTSERNWHLVVEDVLLDIGMANALSRCEGVVPMFGPAFSRKKVELALRTKEKTAYGPIQGEIDYISLASLCRATAPFNCERYLSLWHNLADSWNRELGGAPQQDRRSQAPVQPFPGTGGPVLPSPIYEQGAVSSETSKMPDAVKAAILGKILSTHPRTGQLSPTRVARIVADLQPGAYFLIRAEKKPRRKIAVRELSYLLGSRKWRTGRLSIVRVETLSRFWKYHPYISIHWFEVPDYDA